MNEREMTKLAIIDATAAPSAPNLGVRRYNAPRLTTVPGRNNQNERNGFSIADKLGYNIVHIVAMNVFNKQSLSRNALS